MVPFKSSSQAQSGKIINTGTKHKDYNNVLRLLSFTVNPPVHLWLLQDTTVNMLLLFLPPAAADRCFTDWISWSDFSVFPTGLCETTVWWVDLRPPGGSGDMIPPDECFAQLSVKCINLVQLCRWYEVKKTIKSTTELWLWRLVINLALTMWKSFGFTR